MFPKLSARAIPFKPVTKPEHINSSFLRYSKSVLKICFSFPKHTTCYFSSFFFRRQNHHYHRWRSHGRQVVFHLFITKTYRRLVPFGRKNRRPSPIACLGVTHNSPFVSDLSVFAVRFDADTPTYLRAYVYLCYTYIIVVPVDLDGLKKTTNRRRRR